MYHGVGWADFERVLLTNESRHCPRCGASLVVAYRRVRRVILLRERLALTVQVDRCTDPTCPLASTGLGPPEEARLALPKFTYGLDVVTEIARLRWVRQRSVPEIHAVLRDEYGLPIAERTVDYATETWQELATAWVMHDGERIDALREQGGIVLAIDGLQPEKGHDTVYVLRDTISRQNLLTRPLSNSASRYLVEVIEEVKALGVPILGVVTDKQQSLVLAVEKALPAVPHQLCQFHFLRDLALPVIDADRKLKTTIKKRLRGIAPVERAVAPQLAQAAAADKDASTVTDARTDAPTDARAEQVAGYCTALRATLTHDGKPPLSPGGLAGRTRHGRSTYTHRCLASAEYRKGGSPELVRLRRVIARALPNAADVAPVRRAYAAIHSLAHILSPPSPPNLPEPNEERCNERRTGAEIKAEIKAQVQRWSFDLGKQLRRTAQERAWREHFRRMIANFGERLYTCYDHPVLPRTNNDLEQALRALNRTERRMTGRKHVGRRLVRTPGLIGAGARLARAPTPESKIAALPAPCRRGFSARRRTRTHPRGAVLAFRRDPTSFLAQLEAQELQSEITK